MAKISEGFEYRPVIYELWDNGVYALLAVVSKLETIGQ